MFMRYNSAMTLAVFFNDKESAIEALSLALARGGRNVMTLAANDPNIDSLRDDPRVKRMFEEASERFGIASKGSESSAR
jgi:hypothetical protein